MKEVSKVELRKPSKEKAFRTDMLVPEKVMKYFKELNSYVDRLDKKLEGYTKENEQTYLTIYQKFVNSKNYELSAMNKELNNILNNNIQSLYDEEIKNSRLRLKVLNKKLHAVTSSYTILENDNKKQRAELDRMQDENKVLRLQLKTRIESNNKLQLLFRMIGEILDDVEWNIKSNMNVEEKYDKLANRMKEVRTAVSKYKVEGELLLDLKTSPRFGGTEPGLLQMFPTEIKGTNTTDSKPYTETTYKKRIESLRNKNEALERQVTLLRTRMGSTIYQRRELEEIFVDCINSVKKDVYKRKLKLKGTIHNNDMAVRLVDPKLKMNITKDIGNTVEKLKAEYEGDNITKYKDLTNEDKINILTLFVSNEKIIEYICNVLFVKYDNIALNFIYSSNKDCSKEVSATLYSAAKKILENTPIRNAKGRIKYSKSAYRRNIKKFNVH